MIRRTWPSDSNDPDEGRYRRMLEAKAWAPYKEIFRWKRRFYLLAWFNILGGIWCLGRMLEWW